MKPNGQKKIAVVLAQGFEEVEAVTVIDFCRRAEIEVFVATIGSSPIIGSRKLSVNGDCLVEDIPEEVDGIAIPGGMPGAANVAESCAALDCIRTLFKRKKLIAAICAAPAVVLEKSGITAGKTITCYPGFEDRIQNAVFQEKRVVVDGNIITSRGPGSAAEFALAIIRFLQGEELANEVRRTTLQPS